MNSMNYTKTLKLMMSLKNTADFVRSAGKYLDNDTVLAEEYLEEVIKEKNLEGKND